MANVKAWFRHCSLEDRKRFKESRCIAPISIGVDVHEGEKLLATLRLLNRSFRECVFLIDDTLQRHTKKFEEVIDDEKALYAISKQEGDAWLERNSSYISRELQIPHKILRWDDWLNHVSYAKSYQRISCLFENDKEYQAAFYFAARAFLKRQGNRFEHTKYSESEREEFCIAYLKEECAVMCLWGIEGGYEFELYPSGRNEAMVATYERCIKPDYPHLLKSVGIYFKKTSGASSINGEESKVL